MTIKPIITNQKSKDDGEEQNQTANAPKAFEDRHVRRTPQKNSNRLKRDHQKRLEGAVRTGLEREKRSKSPYPSLCPLSLTTNTTTNNLGRASSPNVLNNVATAPSQVTNQDGETYSGYNSGDEHSGRRDAGLTENEWKQRDEEFVKIMGKEKFIVKEIEEDGACLFRAISLQIYGDQDMHDDIRQQTMDYISQNREYFAQFVTEDITGYIARKRKKNVHGNHIEIQAMSEIYNRPVELYCYQAKPINIFNSEQRNNGYEPLRLSYQRCSHYNAILNPYKASVGVGLGLAGYQPDELDLKQMHEAVRVSEQLEIEQTMFEDKLKTTDWDATNEVIEEQIARESYLQWCRDNMQRSKKGATATVTSASLGMPGSSNSGLSLSRVEEATSTAISGDVNLCEESSSLANMISCNGGQGGAVENNNSNIVSLSPGAIAGRMSPKQYQSDDQGLKNSSSSGSSSPLATCSSSGSSMSSAELRQRRRRRRTGKGTGDLLDSPRSSISRPLNLMETRSTDSNDSDVSDETPNKKLKMRQQTTTEDGSDRLSGTLVEPGPSRRDTEASAGGPGIENTNFYHSLLESSYNDDGKIQMSESEMIQRALHMSRIDYITNLQKNSGNDSS